MSAMISPSTLTNQTLSCLTHTFDNHSHRAGVPRPERGSDHGEPMSAAVALWRILIETLRSALNPDLTSPHYSSTTIPTLNFANSEPQQLHAPCEYLRYADTQANRQCRKEVYQKAGTAIRVLT